MKKTGFTLLEIAIVCTISVMLLGVVFKIYSWVTRYFESGMSRVNFFMDVRLALEHLKKDVRESGWRIEISPDQHILKLRKFVTDPRGIPEYDPQGFLLDGEGVEYTFQVTKTSPPQGNLIRNGKIILPGVADVVFSLKGEMINNIKIPSVVVDVSYNLKKDSVMKFATSIVPRHLATWAQHQYWASITNGQRLKYKF